MLTTHRNKILFILAIFFSFSLTAQIAEPIKLATKQEKSSTIKPVWKKATSNGYSYQYVAGDPSKTRFYVLKNGLTVVLSPSHEEPKIQTFIAVKAGSKTDPSSHTGLAHYLEHLLFKGTQHFGTKDWKKEKPYLDTIQNLYEKYNKITDESQRTKIYAEIDRVSGEASHYAIANEYDKMMGAMGATGTNAFTSFEETVYQEDIPSNAIDRYLTVQAERFRDPVFRLFHTELEAVYEEKNRSLDNDGDKVFHRIFKMLFPHNNYGQQTTIGTIHDLKNPSLIAIRNYFNTYYVPNNMGIIMAGDFDPDQVIKKIDTHFSYMKPKKIPPYVVQPEKPIEKPISSDVYGPEPARLMIGYRFPGASSKDAQMLNLIGEILSNGSAGLLDIDLVKHQKLSSAYAYPYILKDYSTLLLGGEPTEGQKLEDVKNLIINEIEKLKRGQFSANLIHSIINNAKKTTIKSNESYHSRAYELMDNFVLSTDWLKKVNYVNRISQITKQDIVKFANKYFNDNYVIIYKRKGKGKSKTIEKVKKPHITPVAVNRDDQSPFLTKVDAIPQEKITPVWVDFKKDIQHTNAGKYEVLAVKNNKNELFSLTYKYNTGDWSSNMLSLAIGYLKYIGTKNQTAEQYSQNFYQLATRYSIYSSSQGITVSMNGLQENFKKSVQLFDQLLKDCIPDKTSFSAYIKKINKERKDDKDDKWMIKQSLRSYAIYGSQNPFNNELSDKELAQLKATDLTNILHNIAKYKHKILYYGPKSAEEIASILTKIHPAPTHFSVYPLPVVYQQKSQTKNTVLFTHYNMVQAEIFWIRNGDSYTKKEAPSAYFFNQYYGGGMGSVVFQTIRESMALAYSTYAYFSFPSRKEYRSIFTAYVGTQADKFDQSVKAMNNLLTTLPESNKSLAIAKTSLRKKLVSNRIIKNQMITYYLSSKRKGLDHDIRKDVYAAIPKMGFKDLESFFNKEIKGRKFTYYILAGKDKVTLDQMKKLGQVKELSLKQLFGY